MICSKQKPELQISISMFEMDKNSFRGAQKLDIWTFVLLRFGFICKVTN